MPARVYIHRKSREALLEMPSHSRRFRRGVERALHHVGRMNVRELRRMLRTGPRTGRIYFYHGIAHRASRAQEPPASREHIRRPGFGRLAPTAAYKVHSWQQMEFGDVMPYGKFLELGTKRMAPRPHLIVTVNNTAGDATVLLQRYVWDQLNPRGRRR